MVLRLVLQMLRIVRWNDPEQCVIGLMDVSVTQDDDVEEAVFN